MATNVALALHTSVEKLLEVGIENRLQAYRELALYLRQRLREIGYEPFTSDEEMAPVLTAAYGPPGIPTGKIVSFVADEYGIKISGGFGEQLAEKIIRVGHMTPTVTRADIDRLIEALAAARDSLKEEG
jgi:alanine-glyoxylate transaminase/serine-glyoxylate transaminase/serine-pyruvate transaminase